MLYNNYETDTATVKWLVLYSTLVCYSKIFVYMLVLNLMLKKKGILYLVDVVVAIITMAGLFYGTFGLNPPSEDLKIIILLACSISIGFPFCLYILAKIAMLSFSQSLEVNKLLQFVQFKK